MEETGFIVVDQNAIHGIGMTQDSAWRDMEESMKTAKIPHWSEIEPDSWGNPAPWKEEDFKTIPASLALLRQVLDFGGNVGFEIVDGIARRETPDHFGST